MFSVGQYVDWSGTVRNPGAISWSRKDTEFVLPAGLTITQCREKMRCEADRLLREALDSSYSPLQRALDTGDMDLLRANIGCITGWLLKGRAYHIIEHVKFHLIDYVTRQLHKQKNDKYQHAAYVMATIKNECLRFIVKVDRPEQFPNAKPTKFYLLRTHLHDTPAPPNSDVVANDWLPLATNEPERLALLALADVEIETKIRKRNAECMKLRRQILDQCRLESSMTHADLLTLFSRVAHATIADDRIAYVVRFMAKLPR